MGQAGRIVEFSRPYGTIVKPLRKHPDAAGYVHRLYELEGFPSEQAQQFEELFMKPVDGLAADALAFMEAGFSDDNDWSSGQRSAWSRFILSLLLRTPEDIAELKSAIVEEWREMVCGLQESYSLERKPNDPQTLQEYLSEKDPKQGQRFAMSVGRRLIDHSGIIGMINNLHWTTVDTSNVSIELLTSDRPVLMSPSLSERQAYIIMPIGPHLLFAACNEKEPLEKFRLQPPGDLVKRANSFVVAHAVRYAYSRSDSQLRFVQNCMSTIRQSSLLERLVSFRAQKNQQEAPFPK